jgi:hypothetical protein
MALVFAAPPIAPPESTRWGALEMTWTGADGSVWDLTDWRTGIALLRGGVTGLHFPKITKYRSESRAVPGHRRRGWRTAGRDVFWPLYVYGGRGQGEAWRDIYTRFFNTIHPEDEGVWSVTAGGKTRTLRLTGRFEDEHQFDRDPYLDGWAIIPVELEPSQPYWSGEAVKVGPFSVPDPVDFIPEDGGPPFHVSAAGTFATATISNPGDVEAFPVWTVVGPLTDVTLGLGGVSADVPFPVADGQKLRIDTDPRNVSATLDGVDVTEDLGLLEFAAVPKGGTVPLAVGATGEGSIRAELVPLYFRAF